MLIKMSMLFILISSASADWKPYIAELTGYCPCVKCCGDFEGKIRKQTANGNMAKPCHTLAAPRSIPFGSQIAVKLYAEKTILGTVEDRGGAIRVKDGVICIDVYFETHKEALQFGRKKNIQIFIKE